MNIIIAETYDALSQQAAQHVIQLLQPLQQPLLCAASGDTPTGLYGQLVQQYQQQQFNPSQWKFVGLDEWAGMDGSTEGSCRYYLNQQLFKPLQIKEENICFFNGKAPDLQEECHRTEAFIQQHDGIDVAILGLGLNGHVGMNEPGTSPLSKTHMAAIDKQTQEVGQKYFQQPQQLTYGLTLGLATLMEAKHILLLVSGSKKAAIVKKVVEAPISQEVPGTLLRQHPSLHLYLDAEAAQELP